MAKVHIINVAVNNNPATFFTPFQFEINFECLEDLQDGKLNFSLIKIKRSRISLNNFYLWIVDLEFKIIYVGSAEAVEFDQTLDQIVVDAVPKGQYKFLFEVNPWNFSFQTLQILSYIICLFQQADPPNIAKIPANDAVGVTVVLITANFKGQEFVRIGYYVNNEYEDPELRDNPPPEPNFNKLVRTIAADQPRVTKFKINWDSVPSTTASNTEVNGGTSAASGSTLPDADMMIDESNNMVEKNINFENSNSQVGFENKENLTKSESNLFQLPVNSESLQQQTKFGSTDKSFINSQNSNLLFENSIDSVMNWIITIFSLVLSFIQNNFHVFCPVFAINSD